MLRSLLFFLCVLSVESLESNIIHSSRETSSSLESEEQPHTRMDANSQNHVRRSSAPQRMRAAAPRALDCITTQGTKCSDSRSKHLNATRMEMDGQQRAAEMSPCVRSRDCEEGLCCALYLTGRRCQRVPALGETCLLRGRTKNRRRLERCDCERSLACLPQPKSLRGQGTCLLPNTPRAPR